MEQGILNENEYLKKKKKSLENWPFFENNHKASSLAAKWCLNWASLLKATTPL